MLIGSLKLMWVETDGWKKAGPSHSDYCASRNSSPWLKPSFDPQLKSGGGEVITRISQIILCSDFYVDRPTVMLTFLTVLDGAWVGISNYRGLVCESCAWTWILLVFKDLRMIKSLDARLVKSVSSNKETMDEFYWDLLCIDLSVNYISRASKPIKGWQLHAFSP